MVSILVVGACGGDGGDDGAEGSTAAPADCLTIDEGWVAAWGASPTPGPEQPSPDRSGESLRALLTPTFGGDEARVRLSNRDGEGPVTFEHVTIAASAEGPAVVEDTLTEVTFDGSASVTVEPGGEVVGDPLAFDVRPFEPLAVSVVGPDDMANQTQHPIARQTSYLTPPGAGDHTADVDGDAFTETTTSRPFVTGLDVRRSEPAGAVVAFGDSITDGYQGEAPNGFPESPEGIDEDGRYPDVLARRLVETRQPLSVVNAGISGNRVVS
ncbi:MAG: SGNH/GDSL hydrolase family protein, partial [Actinomycetota bacterium]